MYEKNAIELIYYYLLTDKTFHQFSLKLYCRYEYKKHYMINRILGLKQLWLQVNGHAWFHLHPRGDAGGLSREYVLRIPSVS